MYPPQRANYIEIACKLWYSNQGMPTTLYLQNPLMMLISLCCQFGGDACLFTVLSLLALICFSPVPMFIQIHQFRRQMFCGACVLPGSSIDFDVIHLNTAPPQYSHLSGLLDVFKAKMVNLFVLCVVNLCVYCTQRTCTPKIQSADESA